MKRIFLIGYLTAVICQLTFAQTLNVEVGNVRYLFPAKQAGSMPYDNGTALTVMGKTFQISEIDTMYVDGTAVTDSAVSVVYSASSAAITVAGNIAQYLTIEQSGAHVSIAQRNDLAHEITYTLSGTSADGGFYMSGSYKATVELSNLTLTNVSATYSGSAIHIQNSKRIKVKPLNGTTNTLVDASANSKGCLYVKGHIEFAQKGTLNVTGNVKHGIKAGEYISIKNSTINVLSAKGDGINCEQYFLMQSGTIVINNVEDDGLQCDIEDATAGSTGELADHEDEDSGNMYFQGGSFTANVTAIAAKGIKAEGNIAISGGTITVTASGNGTWDTDDLETKSSSCINSDDDITITGGTITLTATGSGGKGLKCDSVLTISGSPVINITTQGGLYYNDGTTENLNYTGNTDDVDGKYYSSPKAIRAGTKTWVSGSGKNAVYTYAGGLTIEGGKITISTSGNNGEGIESKKELVINGGEIFVNAHDDAINAAGDLTINGGLVYARSTNNDAIDANGNVYIKGGVIYAIGATTPEVAIDANSEDRKKLYVTGGTIVAIGGLESGASLSQSCYAPPTSGYGMNAKNWTANTWYAMTYGTTTFAFKTPANGGSKMVVSASSTPTLKSGVTVTSGTEIFGGVAYTDAVVSNGSSVTLQTYTSSGGGPGGGGRPVSASVAASVSVQ